MGKNIILIGFMGTGKSTVGYRLSQKLRREFIDMDREIERITGMPVSALFRKYGETRFRSEEQLLAQKLGRCSDLVIATGGGVVLEPENIRVLRENGIIICLDATPEDIFERVNRKKRTRPLLKKNFQVEDIKKMLAEREPLYACADYRVNTSYQGANLYSVVDEIIKVNNTKIEDEFNADTADFIGVPQI